MSKKTNPFKYSGIPGVIRLARVFQDFSKPSPNKRKVRQARVRLTASKARMVTAELLDSLFGGKIYSSARE